MKKAKYLFLVLAWLIAVGACVASGAAVSASPQEQPENVKLIRFDLHKSFNQEVGVPAGIPGFFTYYYQGKEYHYGFRFNKNGKGVESQVFGTAYVWVPYSIVHYDAAGGQVVEDAKVKKKAANSTAYLGNVSLVNTRGDGTALENSGNEEQISKRYATDYTIYGNSLNLSEGKLPIARREGYIFQGWYICEEDGEIQIEKPEKLAKEKKFEELSNQLNAPFTQVSKVVRKQEQTPLEEITVYAKWKKE